MQIRAVLPQLALGKFHLSSLGRNAPPRGTWIMESWESERISAVLYTTTFLIGYQHNFEFVLPLGLTLIQKVNPH